MKHLILAEIRKSNAPAWVAEELEKKLDCQGCWNAMAKRSARVYPAPRVKDRFSANSRGCESKSSGNRTIPAKA
jgi:hypothetical protein